jgi:hypothetical protein
MQTRVPVTANRHAAGMCHTYRQRVLDLGLLEDVKPGSALVRGTDARTARMPAMNEIVSTLSADMVSGGTFEGVFKVIDMDGNETTGTISEAFDTSQAVTAAAIAAAIEAVDADIDVTISGSNRVFTIRVGEDKRLQLTTAFTRTGSGTATVSNVKGSTDTVIGIAERDTNAFAVLDADYTEPVLRKGTMAACVQQGDPAVVANNATTPGAAVYALLEDYTDTATVLNLRGSFRTNTDSAAAPVLLVSSAEFTNTRDNGLAAVAINKP